MRTRFAALLLCLAGTPCVAQSSLGGTIRDQVTGRPIAGAEILLGPSGTPILSDSTGSFLVPGLSPGTVEVLIRRLGYNPVRFEVALRPAGPTILDIDLAPAAVTLDSVSVSATPLDRSAAMARYAERKARGSGQFIDSDVLRRREHTPLYEILDAARGVNAQYRGDRGMTRRVALNSRKSGCAYSIILDGMVLYRPGATGLTRGGFSPRGAEPPALDQFNTRDIEAIEIYTGPAELPPELNGIGSECGVIVLHSRQPAASR